MFFKARKVLCPFIHTRVTLVVVSYKCGGPGEDWQNRGGSSVPSGVSATAQHAQTFVRGKVGRESFTRTQKQAGMDQD